MSDRNPYAAPRAPVTGAVQPDRLSDTISARLERRGWLFRRIRLTGRVNATIEFNGRWPSEVVRRDGMVVSRLYNGALLRVVLPAHEFDASASEGSSRARLELDASWWPYPGLRAVRLFVDDELVYVEKAR